MLFARTLARTRPLLSTAGLALAAGWALTGPAAAVQSHTYADQVGATVTFENIVETADDPPHPAPPLFGGDLIGTFGTDTLVFDPSGAYVAERNAGVEGVGTTTTASTLDLDVIVIDDSTDYITKIILEETGDFNISGDAEATVSATLQFRVTEIDGLAGISPVATATMTFSPLGSNGNGSYDASDSGGLLVNYAGSLVFDVGAFLALEGISFSRGATAIEIFTVNNQLNAIIPSGGTGDALIQKKNFSIEIVTAPEPTSGALLALGLLGLAAAGRRRA